jgi:tetrahydromethanopterin:alpha-L-glutamate ligase
VKELQREVAIVTDEPGWHGRQLKKSLKKHDIKSQYVSLTDCIIVINRGVKEIIIPGFNTSPLGIFVRGVPGGTLEQVIFRLNILHALYDSGIPVYNTPKAIERTVDKSLTSLLLSRAGIPTPTTWICETPEHAKIILDKETLNGEKIVSKPLFGSQGVGIHLLDNKSGLIHDEKFAGIYYLQRFIERQNNEYTDIRVLVLDGVAKAAMLRRGKEWLTNRSQGASCEPLILDKSIADLAESACKILNIDYAGVDIIQDKKGHFYIIEVNSIPAWHGLQSVVNFDIASCLIDSFVGQIDRIN